MALFSRKKEDTAPAEEPKTQVKKAHAAVVKVHDRNLSTVLKKPRITEKAVAKGEQNVYTFLIRQDATKYDVRDAIRATYQVTPIRINIVNQSPRSYMSRTKGRTVTQKGLKKAYVYLKKGDSIELV